MLFDECERTVQDVAFRSTIINPIDHFFRYRDKAMVSATPITPSDPRFEEQGFRLIEFKPNYDYKQTLHLIHTDSTPATLHQEISKRLECGDKVCVFFNSVESIGGLILTYGLQERTNIYCGEEGVKTLNAVGFDNVFSSLTPLAQINFFTSRFYSAVDIDVEPTDKVSVIMVSDTSLGRYSLIDPTTEAVQIVGRFRAGVNYISHIVRTTAECCSTSNIKEELEAGENIYNSISQITPTTTQESNALTQALEGMDYNRYARTDGSRNYFMWDNATNAERVKGYYEQSATLENIYKRHFKITVSNRKIGSFVPLKKAERRVTSQDVLKVLADYYSQHPQQEAEESIAEMMNTLRTFGVDYVKSKEYNLDKLKIATQKKNCEDLLLSDEAFGYIYNHIKSGDAISVSRANEIVGEMIETLSIPYTKRITTSLLKRYFNFTNTHSKSERRIKIGEPTRADLYNGGQTFQKGGII